MSWFQELQNAIVGSWRLVLRDLDGLNYFVQSEAGFWRSFSAIVIIAPIYLYTIELQNAAALATSAGADEAGEPVSLAMSAVSLAVQWVAWPLAMAVITKYAGLAAGFSRYIIVYNWSSILVMAVQVPAIYLFAQGGEMAGLGRMLFIATLAVVIYYRWYITVVTLETTAAIASALVLADLVLSIGIARLIG